MEGPDSEHNLRLSMKKPSGEMIAAASFNKLVERLTTSSSQHGEQCLLRPLRRALHKIVHTYVRRWDEAELGNKRSKYIFFTKLRLHFFHTIYLSLSPTLRLSSLPSLFRYAVCEDLSTLIPVLHNTTAVARETGRALQCGATRGDVPERVPRSEDHNPGTYIPTYVRMYVHGRASAWCLLVCLSRILACIVLLLYL